MLSNSEGMKVMVAWLMNRKHPAQQTNTSGISLTVMTKWQKLHLANILEASNRRGQSKSLYRVVNQSGKKINLKILHTKIHRY
jgi:hypothetical protein